MIVTEPSSSFWMAPTGSSFFLVALVTLLPISQAWLMAKGTQIFNTSFSDITPNENPAKELNIWYKEYKHIIVAYVQSLYPISTAFALKTFSSSAALWMWVQHTKLLPVTSEITLGYGLIPCKKGSHIDSLGRALPSHPKSIKHTSSLLQAASVAHVIDANVLPTPVSGVRRPAILHSYSVST